MNKFLLFTSLFFTSSCEILEEDISSERVRILAPIDRSVVRSGTIDFRWLVLKSAVGYEFTVVSPSFNTATRILVDTVLYTDSLSRHYGCRITLPVGEYEWSVTGFNNSYTTSSDVRSLIVTSSE